MSRSSVEVEYCATAYATCEITWLGTLLNDFSITLTDPTSLFCNNQAALHITANPVFYERTKHIKIDYHIVQENFQQ